MAQKILVIDDNPDILDLEKNRFESERFDVITASDAIEGMVKTKNQKPDLIILDVILPNLDGYTFLRQLKVDPEIKRIPVIVLTSRGQLKDLFKIEGVHDEDFLVKPFDGQELVNRVHQMLGE